MKLKNIKDQVIVITGASSGIGLATAKLAAQRGAKVVLASRNLDELRDICAEIETSGGQAIAVRCDVANPDEVQNVADRAVSDFGRIDTWVNNAGISIYGKLWEVELEEKRRLFDVNFWGVVYGCRSALKSMRDSGGGAIINVGSALSDRTVPIQGMYAASKHAVKAYTDALRMEVEAEQMPFSVTLIKPSAVDTPYIDHAVNKMEHHPTHPKPVIPPESVAKAILDAAETSQRDVYVGGAAKMFSLMETFLPRLTDLFMEKTMMEAGQSDARLDAAESKEALYTPPVREGATRGTYNGHVAKGSAFTTLGRHPALATLVATGLGVAAAAGVNYLARRRSNPATLSDIDFMEVSEPADDLREGPGSAIPLTEIYVIEEDIVVR